MIRESTFYDWVFVVGALSIVVELCVGGSLLGYLLQVSENWERNLKDIRKVGKDPLT